MYICFFSSEPIELRTLKLRLEAISVYLSRKADKRRDDASLELRTPASEKAIHIAMIWLKDETYHDDLIERRHKSRRLS
jgi:hypothetical protein